LDYWEIKKFVFKIFFILYFIYLKKKKKKKKKKIHNNRYIKLILIKINVFKI